MPPSGPGRRPLCIGLAFAATLIGTPSWAQTRADEYRTALIVTLPPWYGVRLLLRDEEHVARENFAHKERFHGIGVLSPPSRYGFMSVELREVHHGSGVVEHRWIPSLNSTLGLAGRFELRNRARVELRDIAGVWSRRYQERAILERQVTVLGGTPVPYVHYDLSYDTRFGELNRREIAAGVRVPVARGTTVDSFLLRQTDHRRADAVIVAAGMILRVAL